MLSLNQAYDRGNYLNFLANKFVFSKTLVDLTINNDAVKIFKCLGFITTADKKKLLVFEIRIDPTTQLARNRVQLRHLVAREIKAENGVGAGDEDGALAVYIDRKNKQWRFSFISIEHIFGEDGVQTKETASKRFTYLLGEGAKTRTATEQFDKLNQQSTLDDLKAAFAVEALSKEFYGKLNRWYETAQQQVKFPNDENAENHIQTSLIRLLTRLLFVWFIKEKGLINADLFNKDSLLSLIDYQKPSSFYKAILQNLFFATLNVEIKNRDFREAKNDSWGRNKNYGDHYRYRYHNLVKDVEKWQQSFSQTPFLNGGLFECLDRKATDTEKQQYEQDTSIRKTRSAIRMDGFSDRPDNELQFDNQLLFNDDEKNLGLIDLFNQYQFTVEESTPTDIDVALDPELLGKVFENLLATYNPETKQLVRKAQDRKDTGSFYTPREIVGYMVDTSLKAYLSQAVPPDDGDNEFYQQRLDDLFFAADNTAQLATENGTSLIYPNEIPKLIAAISQIKIIDPAVGSGAFPMGILQRLVALLSILDPKNEQWKNQQLAIVAKLTDSISRKQASEDIEAVFSAENANNNYGRKLYLIENCIYGVDIQSIAIQICKLRFFISLAIEHKPNKNADDNYGIKALPNLETKFIVANTLLPLGEQSKQAGLFDTDIDNLKIDLATVRQQHYSAANGLKTKYRAKDKKIRQQIFEKLQHSGISPAVEESMQKMLAWDLYNQNAVAAWFDPEWMFSIKDGFDIVIGNPPYLRVQGIEKEASRQYKTIFKASTGSYDLYVLFAEKGLSLLSENGILNYIMPHKWVNSAFGKGLREISKNNIYKLVSFEAYQVFNASTYTSLVWFGKSKSSVLNYVGLEKNLDTNQELEKYLTTLSNKDFLKIDNQTLNSDSWILTSQQNHDILEKINQQPLKVSDIFERIFQGIATSKDSVYFLTDIVEKDQLIECYSKELDKRILIEKVLVKPLLKGDDVHRYETLSADKIVIFPYYITSENNKERAVLYSEAEIKNKFPNGYRYLKECEDVLRNRESGRFDIDGEWFQYGRKQGILFANKEKIITPYLSLSSQLSYDKDGEFYGNTKCFGLIKHLDAKGSYKFYLAILNSQLTWFFIKNTSSIMSGGYFTYTKDSLSSFPLPRIANLADTKPFEKLVDKIIIAKKTNQDSSDLEAQIDKLVYKLYNLTATEIKIIEASK